MDTIEKPISEMSKAEVKEYLANLEKEEQKKADREKKEYTAEKDQFLLTSIEAAESYNAALSELKKNVLLKANEFYNRMYEIQGKDPKETKSFSLKNSDDTLKVTVDRQERFEFTEEAMVHINAIKDIFKDKFAERNKGLYNILDGLLIKGSKGEYDPKLLAKARRQVRDLGDVKLIAEFDKLDDCQRVTGTAMYCRFYKKNQKGKWEDISLQFSSL